MTARFGFPINLAVRDRRCVVIGGGTEAALRVRRLRDAGADLLVLSPRPCAQLLSELDARVRFHPRGWEPADLDGAAVVIATREDPLDAARLYALATARGALVNVLDDVDHCDFAAMSQVVHGDLQLSVATNGRAPAVAKVIRRRLEASFGPAWGELVDVVDEARTALGPRRIDFPEWARRWSLALADADHLVEQLRHGDRHGVRDHLVETVGGEAGPATPPVGPVHLVGAGPGDPELLTVRAARLLAAADLVVHDQLVPAPILALAAHAELVPVGRRLGHVVLPHEQVIDLLAEAARAGRRVVRLKGGDPVVFGRGAEEALELARRGVPAELVPGISSAIAAPELAGIPLTHRGVAAGFLVVTGQHAAGRGARVDWELAATFDGTLVILMGATRLAELLGALRAHGRPASTPAAIVQHAGRPEQRVLTGTIGDLPTLADAAGIGTPAVVVVGEVVALRERTRRHLDAPAPPPTSALETSTAACL
jgi:uroporphyrin-III C-methyltransferase / precorrin-2 dehydrogenase / sirohydrochlorin ferrochelatase